MPASASACCGSPDGVPGEHATLPLQGCGHFITEAAIRTFVPLGRKLLIPATGSYADRMIRLAREAGRVPVPLPYRQIAATDPDAVAAALSRRSRTSAMSASFTARPAAASCTTLPRSARWCGGSGGG